MGKTDAKERSQRVVDSMSKDMKSVAKFLVGVVTGKVKDEYEIETKDKETGELRTEKIKKPASLSVRVSAAKQYKELIIDKQLPDEKVNPKKPETSRTKYKDALNELEESIHAAKSSEN